MNGDGYTDLSGGLLYFISDGETVLPGGVCVHGRIRRRARSVRPGEMLAGPATTTRRSRGTGRNASNIVGQGVINGRGADVQLTCSRGGTYPGAVIGGAPKAKVAPFGDIYFSFEFSTQFGYLLARPRHGIDVTSNSYGSSEVDNDS